MLDDPIWQFAAIMSFALSRAASVVSSDRNNHKAADPAGTGSSESAIVITEPPKSRPKTA